MKVLKSKYFFILIIIIVATFWIWWIGGPRVANDFSYISSDFLKLQLDMPRAWNERGAEGLGEYGVFILWSYPINLIFGALTYIGLNFQIWERILIILFILLGSMSIWKLLGDYALSDKAKLIGSISYLLNTYTILLIDGGQISIALAYALFPLTFLIVCKAVYLNLKSKIVAGFFVVLLGFFDIRFIFILFLLIFLKTLFELVTYRKNNPLMICKRWFFTGLIITVVVITLNAFWLFAYIKTPIAPDIFESFTKISDSLINIGHSFLLISPHWFKNVFGKISPLYPEFILLPILVLLAPIFWKKDKNIAFWLFVAVLSIFLTKGGGEPLPSIYPYLHSNIPGFSFFRDSTKFFFLVTLSYSVLLTFTSEKIFRIFLKKRISGFILIAFIAYLIYLIRPVFLNQMTGTFSIQSAEKEFLSLNNILQNDKNFGRVFWIPTTFPLSYSDLKHPIVEASRVFNRIPFVFGVKGTYEIFNFLRESPYMGEIFDIASIAYIAYPFPDIKKGTLSADDKSYYHTFLGQLNNLPWTGEKIDRSTIPLLKTSSHKDRIFAAKNSWIVFGSDEVFLEATKSAGLTLANNGIIFAEDKLGNGFLFDQFPEAKIILNKKTETDLAASFIPERQVIFPASQLSVKPNQAGWWKNDGKDLISWRDFLQTKYNIDNKDFDLEGGWAVGEGASEYQISNTKYQKGNVLLARVMESSRSGKLSFYQGDKLIGAINTNREETTLRWFEVGILLKASDLIIKTEGDINVINALATVDPADWRSYQNQAKGLSGRITEFIPGNTDNALVKTSYKRINQTRYRILVSDLTSPGMMVFSATYHPGWKLNGISSVAAYGFLNGFQINRNGEFILEFAPQKDIQVGMIISLFGCILLISYLLIGRRKPDV